VRRTWLRAVEWCCWPSYISALFVPVLLFWVIWWKLLLCLLLANLIWIPVRYRITSFALSDFSATVVLFCKWPISIVCFGVMIYQHRIGISFLALLWPLIHGFFVIPGKIGIIQNAFLIDMFGLPDDCELERLNMWAPILKGEDSQTMSLAVPCGTTALGLDDYRDRLMWRMHELIERDPKQSGIDLDQAGDIRVAPNLYSIRREYEAKDWAVQISISDQMSLLLGRIDWSRDNPPYEGTEKDLPSLMEYLQRI